MNRKYRKVMTISVVVLWAAAVVAVMNAALIVWHRGFDWASIGAPGLILAVALVMTVAWWSLKDDKTDQVPP